jgi:hypothetical protein
VILYYIGEVSKRMKKGKPFYTLQDFLWLSLVGKPYKWICTHLMSTVVGNKAWTKKKHKETLTDIATCSDETFVLLTIENNYDHWMSEASWCFANEDKEPAECAPKMFPTSKYTNSGKSQKNGRSKRLQGWSRDGYERFNELYTGVQNDRLRRANFETELLSVWRNSEALMTPHIREVAVE